jgi:hypothetical protein
MLYNDLYLIVSPVRKLSITSPSNIRNLLNVRSSEIIIFAANFNFDFRRKSKPFFPNIHKNEGSTFNKAGVFLTLPVSGLLYAFELTARKRPLFEVTNT